MTETSHPIPDGNATLERHGIRGIDGVNLVAQIAPLNERYIQLGSRLRNDSKLRGQKWLCVDMQFQIITKLVGAETRSLGQATATMTAAYRRTFGEWVELFEQKYHWYTPKAVQQQLANAWRDVEELLINHPR